VQLAFQITLTVAAVASVCFVLLLVSYMIESTRTLPTVDLVKLEQSGTALFRLALLAWLGVIITAIWR
jgi:hypothetical protein